MKDLKITAIEYAAGVKKLTEDGKKLFGAMVLEENFEPEHLELLQNVFGMLETSTRLVCEQAIMIQEINDKLDRLLAIKERES